MYMKQKNLDTPWIRAQLWGMMSIDELIRRANGVTRLAEIAGVRHPTISAGWRRSGQVPVARVRRISAALGIPMHELRPDVWHPPTPRSGGSDAR